MLHHRPGFTLVETLIYTAFVGMIMTSMTLLVSATFTMRSKLRATVILDQNVRFAALRINALVNEAGGMSAPSLASSSGTLVLTMTATSTNPTTIKNSGGIITVTQGAGGSAQALTSDEVSFSNLTFTRVSSTSAMVRMVMTASPRGSPSSYGTLTVTTTAAIRR